MAPTFPAFLPQLIDCLRKFLPELWFRCQKSFIMVVMVWADRQTLIASNKTLLKGKLICWIPFQSNQIFLIWIDGWFRFYFNPTVSFETFGNKISCSVLVLNCCYFVSQNCTGLVLRNPICRTWKLPNCTLTKNFLSSMLLYALRVWHQKSIQQLWPTDQPGKVTEW